MNILKDNHYAIGCNYWASNAGTNMWSNWSESAVRRDFGLLAGAGLQLIRVFPLWPVFQPLELHRTCMGYERELQFNGRRLPYSEAGRAGMDESAMEKFLTLADIAESQGLKLLVGLITGWMSGEQFVPQAFAGRNVLSDPLVLKWQVKFVRHFVKTFKSHPAIVAWEPGNECNCMAPVESREQAWLWANTITSAIRSEDSERPVLSGMHGLYPSSANEFNVWENHLWSIQDQGEQCDMLTAHPYPHSPTKKAARLDVLGGLRSNFQAVTESLLYGDIGCKPCLIEEIGTFGPMVCDEEMQETFINNVLWNTWAHDSRGLLWWCGFDQSQLEYSPYAWNAWERELGLFRNDGSEKPVLKALKKFGKFQKNLPFSHLPPFRRDAVCILTRGFTAEENLANSWSSLLLAKQAGFDLEFQYVGEPLKDSQLYIMPCLKGSEGIGRDQWLALMKKVEAGATLYISLDSGHLAPFTEFSGLKVRNREEREMSAEFSFSGYSFNCATQYRLEMESVGARVLAEETDGNPIFACNSYGKGEIWLLAAAAEKYLGAKPRAFDDGAQPFYLFYQTVAAKILSRRLVRSNHPQVTVTEHFFDDDNAIAILFNHYSEELQCELLLKHEWSLSPELSEKDISKTVLSLPAKQGKILQLMREKKTAPGLHEFAQY